MLYLLTQEKEPVLTSSQVLMFQLNVLKINTSKYRLNILDEEAMIN